MWTNHSGSGQKVAKTDWACPPNAQDRILETTVEIIAHFMLAVYVQPGNEQFYGTVYIMVVAVIDSQQLLFVPCFHPNTFVHTQKTKKLNAEKV